MNMGMYLDGRRALRSASISDVAAGGSIGSVDNYDAVLINQTTAAKVLTFATPTVNEFRKLVMANVGSAGFYAYGRFIRPGGAHTFVYVPSVGWRRTSSSPQVIEQNWTDVTAPANDTNENTLFTMTIPGGVMGANGVLMLRTKFDYTNSANTKTFRARLDGTLLCSFSTTTTGAVGIMWDICNRNSESAQVGTNGAGGGSAGGSTNTATIDTSAATTLTITAQKATGTETITLLGVSVILQRFD